MKRAILIDGNNLIFRSYFATAYNGNLMRNSEGLATNALFGFVNMINKIIEEEKPEYALVAFDKGKTFRHNEYKEYKAGRNKTPDDLKNQMPIAKEILTYLGIPYLEVDNYEADDIIGTFARMADEDEGFHATIVSSDRDLLQLISKCVNVKLLKTKDHIYYNEESFMNDYGIKPIRVTDLKGLEGDASDNIPGVKGVGEKTALTLLKKYDTLEDIYDDIDNIKGKLQEKLILDKDNAFFSKKLATICRDVPVGLTLEETKMKEIDYDNLFKLFQKLEFNMFIKKLKEKSNVQGKEIKFNISNDISNINKPFSFYLELDNENYNNASFVGMSIYDGEYSYYLTLEDIINNKDLFKYAYYTFDLKKAIVFLHKYGIELENAVFDTNIALYLLNKNIKDSIEAAGNIYLYDINPYSKDILDYSNELHKKSMFIYNTYNTIKDELIKFKLDKLFKEIEMPLVRVLSDMEINGFRMDPKVIDELKIDVSNKLKSLEEEIYSYAGESFNISSPKQLGVILYEKLKLPFKKTKGSNGFSTSHEVLIKLMGMHPIIELIINYRELSKLYSTYLSTLNSYILDDGKVHSIFTQTITRTGRLSSLEPNLQNIPVRTNEGSLIRKAFIPESDSILLSCDYSQIELRVLAHISKDDKLISAFNNNEDIHSIVASDIYGCKLEEVTPNMRRNAKGVIFGIVYGISGYGLSENLGISVKEADTLINKYLEMYPSVNKYMDDIKAFAYKDYYVSTLLGRIRYIDELRNTNYMIRQAGERIALNTPIQGSSADIIKIAMINVSKYLKENNLKSSLILQVHDELILNVKNSEKEEVIKNVTRIMESAYNLVVPLKVSNDTGLNWHDLK